MENQSEKAKGMIPGFDPEAIHTVKIGAENDVITAYIDASVVSEYICRSEPSMGAGRAALYSAYYRNGFDNLSIEPIDGADTYIRRYDNTDVCFEYEGEWDHNTMSSFQNYKRTISKGKKGASNSLKRDILPI